ncbi:MAG: hypothetical protein LBT00_00675 [Spirochaetaceae bacterium]|nr:hypothetical protein [Spirochaetaceae bacterium]
MLRFARNDGGFAAPIRIHPQFPLSLRAKRGNPDERHSPPEGGRGRSPHDKPKGLHGRWLVMVAKISATHSSRYLHILYIG